MSTLEAERNADQVRATREGSRYLLVTPCRNEEAFCRRTLDTVVTQSLLPALWIIVDDGSSDATPTILDEYARRHPFIRIVRREDRGARSVGPGVIEAFYAGYATVDPSQFDYVCKLDLDLELPPTYFESLISRMASEPRLGTCSGKPWFRARPDGPLVSESIGDETSAGMTKLYRRRCFEEIGGFVREVMWDGIDCHRCRMQGWMAESVDTEDLRFIHLRPMGSSDKGILTGRVRWGYGQYFMGTWPPFLIASAVFRIPLHPVLLGSAAMIWGYFKSAYRGEARYDDLAFRTFLRRYQRACLLHGKREATRRMNEAQAPVWQGGRATHA